MNRSIALSVIASCLALTGCTDVSSSDEIGPDTTGGKEDSGQVSATKPVRLRFAHVVDARWTGVIDVADVGTNKDVTVLWRSETSAGHFGAWHETPAQFLTTLDDSHPAMQLWSFRGVGDDFNGRTELKVRYRSSGGEFQSALYNGLEGLVNGIGDVAVAAPIGEGLNLAVINARVAASVSLDLDILIRNVTLTKQVKIVYTLDQWQTVQTSPAFYQYGGQASHDLHGAERWLGHVSMPEGTERIDYAVVVKQGGSESWDNNFGENFGCIIETPAEGGHGACWGSQFAL